MDRPLPLPFWAGHIDPEPTADWVRVTVLVCMVAFGVFCLYMAVQCGNRTATVHLTDGSTVAMTWYAVDNGMTCGRIDGVRVRIPNARVLRIEEGGE